jgi:hypothetical protein
MSRPTIPTLVAAMLTAAGVPAVSVSALAAELLPLSVTHLAPLPCCRLLWPLWLSTRKLCLP